MSVVAWPLVDRSRLVHAFRPGERSAAEGPFRTLRFHSWASSGVRLKRRVSGRLAGQVTMFSSLNVEAARLARHGLRDAARRIARAATEIEASPDFIALRDALAALPDERTATMILTGVVPDEAPPVLMDLLKDLAIRTEEIRKAEQSLIDSVQVEAGQITEVHEGYVLLLLAGGPSAAVPRWMAVAANRAQVGEFLALVTDKLDAASAVVEAMPAIDVTQADEFSPFGRTDSRARTITVHDRSILAGVPEPLRVLVPVLIEE